MTVHTAVMAISLRMMASSDFCHIYEYLAHDELPCNKKLAFKTVEEAQQYIIEDGTQLLYHLNTPHIRHLPRPEKITMQLAVPENSRFDVLQQYHDKLAQFFSGKSVWLLGIEIFLAQNVQ